jgi:hypothetical protein
LRGKILRKWNLNVVVLGSHQFHEADAPFVASGLGTGDRHAENFHCHSGCYACGRQPLFASTRPHANESKRVNSSVMLMDIDAMTRNAKDLPVSDVESFH